MNHHDVIWTQPPALIPGSAARVLPTPRIAVQRPVILRFTTDSFMDEFFNVIETRPQDLAEYKVRRETWRGITPTPTTPKPATPSIVYRKLGIPEQKLPAILKSPRKAAEPPPGTPLKLYQPSHQRHYLIACSLVCKTPGLPDRMIAPGRGERIGAVIRRLLPPPGKELRPVEEWEEHAWVAGEHGAAWRKVGAVPSMLVDEEERLPLFTVNFEENHHRRRIHAGVIPVGRREAYLGAPRATNSGTSGVTARTARKVLLRKEVIEPWKTVVRQSLVVNRGLYGPFLEDNKAPNNTQKVSRLKLEREQIQTVSWYILLDFAKYLSTYLKPVWRALLPGGSRSTLLPPEQRVLEALEQCVIPQPLKDRLAHKSEVDGSGDNLYVGKIPASLKEALALFGAAPEGLNLQLERQLEVINEPYNRHDAASRSHWPDFIFPLADPDLPDSAPLPPAVTLGALTADENDAAPPGQGDPRMIGFFNRLDQLAILLLRALRDDDDAPQPAVPTAAIAPADPLTGWFVMRCVYERPGCEPLHSAVASEPTERFQLAGFFDADAPARPIRIGLPIDTTTAGLRKFDKNTAFVISDTLCGQIGRAKGLTLGDLVLSVLPWPFHKDLPNPDGGPCKSGSESLGMICSLSIPIITLCALILLIIMVSILDIFFRWIPYFIVCFPFPGLSAKKEA